MRFDANWKLTLFVVIFLPMLIALGVWQLERADDKRLIEARQQRAALLPPRSMEALLDPAAEHLMRVRVSGRLDVDRLVLLDNRTHEGRVGYEVFAMLTPAASQPAVLLGFGWVPAPPLRSELPQPELPAGPVSLLGEVARETEQAPVFGAVVEAGSWPLRVQRLDLDQIAEAFGVSLYAWPVMVAAGEPGVQTHVFEAVRMSADTHRGYAVQWFGLATVLAIGWLLASLKRRGPGVARQHARQGPRARANEESATRDGDA